MGLALSLAFTLTVLSLLMGILGNFLMDFIKKANSSFSEFIKAKDAGDTANEGRYKRETIVYTCVLVMIIIVIGVIVFYLMGAGSLAMTIDENPKLNLSANLTCKAEHSCTGFVTNTPPLICPTTDLKPSESPPAVINFIYVARPPYAFGIEGLKQMVNDNYITGYQIQSFNLTTIYIQETNIHRLQYHNQSSLQNVNF